MFPSDGRNADYLSRCLTRGNHVRKPFRYRNASYTASTGEGQASCPGSPWSRTFRRPDLPGSNAGQADDSFPSCGPLGAGRRRSRERGRVGRRRAATARERCRAYGCFLHVTGIRARLHVNSRSPSGHAHTKLRSRRPLTRVAGVGHADCGEGLYQGGEGDPSGSRPQSAICLASSGACGCNISASSRRTS